MPIKLRALLLQVQTEMQRAEAKHGDLHSHHEAYGVLCEEIAEYFDEVRKQEPHVQAMRDELLQIAAVALRTALHLT